MAYGLDVESESDKFYAASEDAMDPVNVAMVPGNFLVDVLPIRMSFDQILSVQTEYFHSNDSQIRSGMVPWSWFQDLRENCEREY